MTSKFTIGHVATALRRAAVRATLAPSVHNTQPWRLHVGHGELRISADFSRQLHVLDPTRRQLTVSGGCALFNARVSLAADGIPISVARLPDPNRPELLATLSAKGGQLSDVSGLPALDKVVETRHTNRRRFVDEAVPADVLDALVRAAAAEDTQLFVVRDPDQRLAVATLSQHADAIENLNPAYRAELRAWTSDNLARRDGVPNLAVPHVDGSSGDEIPIRDFDTRGSGMLPAGTRSSMDQCLVLLCTEGDTRAHWLRAGEALQRVLLEITLRGYVVSPLTQVTEVPSARAQLRNGLRLTSYPHLMLRIGRAPTTPASRRRRLGEVIVEER